MKKRLSMLICSILLFAVILSMFTGCSKKNEPKVTDTNAPVELTFFNWELGKFGTDANVKPLPVYDEICKKLNIKIIPINAPYNNWENSLSIKIAANEVPDLFIHWGFDRREQFNKWIQDGMLYPMDENSTKYPNLAKQLTRFKDAKAAMQGKFYALPISNMQDEDVASFNDHALYIRQDWLDSLNLKMPTTIDEFKQVAIAFATKDPDKNGKADTSGYGLTNLGGIWWWYPIFHAFGVDQGGWEKVDGKWQPDIISAKMKDSVKFMADLYSQKGLDTEFMTTSYDQMRDKFVGGKIGIMAYNAGPPFYAQIYDSFVQVYPDKDPKTVFSIMPVSKGIDGKQSVLGFPNFWSLTSINGLMGDAKITKAQELLDYLLSDEGLTLLRHGIKDVHYKMEGDKFIPTLPKYESGKMKKLDNVDPTTEVLKRLVTWDKGFFLEDTIPYLEDQLASREPFMKAAELNELFYVAIPPENINPIVSTELGDLVDKTFIKLAADSSDFEADWNAFVAEWKSKGGDKVIDEMNKAASAAGK